MVLLMLDQPEQYHITIVDNLSRGSILSVNKLQKLAEGGTSTVKFVHADVHDFEKMVEVLTRDDIQVVVHFAGFAYASESVSSPLAYFENTAEGTRTLLSAMEATKVNQLVYSSSSATYGDIENQSCDVCCVCARKSW